MFQSHVNPLNARKNKRRRKKLKFYDLLSIIWNLLNYRTSVLGSFWRTLWRRGASGYSDTGHQSGAVPGSREEAGDMDIAAATRAGDARWSTESQNSQISCNKLHGLNDALVIKC